MAGWRTLLRAVIKGLSQSRARCDQHGPCGNPLSELNCLIGGRENNSSTTCTPQTFFFPGYDLQTHRLDPKLTLTLSRFKYHIVVLLGIHIITQQSELSSFLYKALIKTCHHLCNLCKCRFAQNKLSLQTSHSYIILNGSGIANLPISMVVSSERLKLLVAHLRTRLFPATLELFYLFEPSLESCH